jgi:hypothetical protein
MDKKLKAVLTHEEMDHLMMSNLYHLAGEYNEVAMPNYRYCREDAPIYHQMRDTDQWEWCAGTL